MAKKSPMTEEVAAMKDPSINTLSQPEEQLGPGTGKRVQIADHTQERVYENNRSYMFNEENPLNDDFEKPLPVSPQKLERGASILKNQFTLFQNHKEPQIFYHNQPLCFKKRAVTIYSNGVNKMFKTEINRKRPGVMRAIENWKKLQRKQAQIYALATMLGNFEEVKQKKPKAKRKDKDKFKWQKIRMSYYSTKLLFFELMVTLLYLYSFFIVPYVLAFQQEPIETIRWLDFSVDLLLLISIIVNIFTPKKIDNVIIEKVGTVLKKHFLSVGTIVWFLLDVASVAPAIFTLEDNRPCYQLKVLRFLRFFKLSKLMAFVGEYFRPHFTYSLEQFNNFLKITKTLIYLTLLFHVLSCIWIVMGQTHEGWVQQLAQQDSDSNTFIYVTSIYFITTVSTTVGYGDYYASNTLEMAYCLSQQFLAIVIFSIISANILSLQYEKPLKHFIEKKQNEIRNMLYQLDQVEGIFLSNELYDSSNNYIKHAYTHGVKLQLQEQDFFESLPPQLKMKLIFSILKKYYYCTYFFFNDEAFGKQLDPFFIRKVLSQLDAQIRPANTEMVKAGEKMDNIFFLYKGSWVLVEKSRKYTFLTLPQQSFFGDYQILLNLKSSYYLMTGESNRTSLVLSLDGQYFQELCDEFPQAKKFMISRALLRRNHFKMEEKRVLRMFNHNQEEYIQQQLVLEKDLSSNSIIGITPATSVAPKKRHALLNIDKVELDVTMDLDRHIPTNLAAPLLRLCIDTMQTMMDQNIHKFTEKWKGYSTLFKILNQNHPMQFMKVMKMELEAYEKIKKDHFYGRDNNDGEIMRRIERIENLTQKAFLDKYDSQIVKEEEIKELERTFNLKDQLQVEEAKKDPKTEDKKEDEMMWKITPRDKTQFGVNANDSIVVETMYNPKK